MNELANKGKKGVQSLALPDGQKPPRLIEEMEL
jgi:hypothetical protein